MFLPILKLFTFATVTLNPLLPTLVRSTSYHPHFPVLISPIQSPYHSTRPCYPDSHLFLSVPFIPCPKIYLWLSTSRNGRTDFSNLKRKSFFFFFLLPSLCLILSNHPHRDPSCWFPFNILSGQCDWFWSRSQPRHPYVPSLLYQST